MTSGRRELAVRSIEERWRALSDAVANLDIPPTAPTAAHHLERFVRAAVAFVSRDVIAFARSQEPTAMTDQEFADTIAVSVSTYKALIRIVYLLGTHTPEPVPLELSESLARVLRRLYPSSDLLLLARPFANYSVTNVSVDLIDPLKKIKGFRAPRLPERIFVVTLPSTETDHALIHCIVAHEFSHSFWNAEELGDSLQLDKSMQPFVGHANQEELTKAIEVARLWAQELASDMFALQIFGPAYVSATIHFTTALTSINLASPSHPPVRARLKWLFLAMDQQYRKKDAADGFTYGAATDAFFATWRAEAFADWEGEVVPELVPDVARLALQAISRPGVFEEVLRLGQELARARFDALYTAADYERDLGLVDYINSHVPPVVWLTPDRAKFSVTAASIMNAAWECYHEGLTQFASRLQPDVRADHLAVGGVYNSFLLKTLELNEIARQWTEISQRRSS